MLQRCFNSCCISIRRIVPGSMMPSKKHYLARHGYCPSIFSTQANAATRKLNSTEEGRSSQVDEDDEKKPDKPNILERLKLGWRKYGIIGVTTYAILYLSTFAQIFFALEYDIFNAESVGMHPATVVKKVSDHCYNLLPIMQMLFIMLFFNIYY
jgi:hypothetical protein